MNYTNRCMYLDQREVAVDELGDRLLPGRELLADLVVLERAVDLGPDLRVLDPTLQPDEVPRGGTPCTPCRRRPARPHPPSSWDGRRRRKQEHKRLLA